MMFCNTHPPVQVALCQNPVGQGRGSGSSIPLPPSPVTDSPRTHKPSPATAAERSTCEVLGHQHRERQGTTTTAGLQQVNYWSA
jgi:hypothetical protein